MVTNQEVVLNQETIGLSDSEAKAKIQQYGLNQIEKLSEIKFLDIAKEEIAEPMILLLLAVVFFYALFGNPIDTLTALGVVIAIILVEIYNEYRSKKVLDTLSKIVDLKSRVIRDGVIIEIKSLEVVPDDVLVLTPGTQVAADCIILTSFNLLVDE